MGMYAHKDYEVLLIISSLQWLNKHDRLPCTTYTRNFFLWKPYWMSTSAQPSTLICSAVYAINTASVGFEFHFLDSFFTFSEMIDTAAPVSTVIFMDSH